MPFPNDYVRGFGFEGFQDSHPSTPLPGTQVDVELDNVSRSTAAIVAFFQKFARSDGRLANGSVGVDQLAPDLTIGFKAPTTWSPDTMYLLHDTVFYGAGFYDCSTPHTSGGSFDPSKWALIVDFGSQAQAAAASAAAAAASATQAATVDGMFSAPVLASATAPAGSPAIGDRYLVAASGTSGVYVGKENQVAQWSGSAWAFSGAPKSGQVLWNTGVGFAYKFDGSSWVKRRSKLAFVSDFATLSAALAFAASATVRLVVDDDRALAANTSISASIPALSFEGGKITLGAFDLTFNAQPVRAEVEQIFDSTSTGKVKGKINGDICIDWWGTTSASVASSVTTNAGNDCLTYAVQSINASHGDTPTVYCGKPLYFLSGSWIKPYSAFGVNLEGNGAVLSYAGIGNGVAALRYDGQSGNLAGSWIDGFQFEGDTLSWGLEIRGQCGMSIRNCLFRTNQWGLVLHNYDAVNSKYTEFVRWYDCAFACRRAWWYKRTSGDGSFHGSGPAGNVIVNYVNANGAPIKADNGAINYNFPNSAQIFPTTISYPLIEGGTGGYWMSHGDLCCENTWGSGTLNVITGSFTACTHTGTINSWGGAFNLGALVLLDSTYTLVDGVVRGRRKGKFVTSVMTAGGQTVTIDTSGSSNWLLEITINLPNYYWQGLVSVSNNPFGATDANLVRQQARGGSLGGTYGNPTFSWDGAAITITNASYPASVNTEAVSIGATDLGKTF